MLKKNGISWLSDNTTQQLPQAIIILLCLRLTVVFTSLLLVWLFADANQTTAFYIGSVAIAFWSLFVAFNRWMWRIEQAKLRELLIDIAWVMIVINVSGGSSNPFIYYLLVLVAIAALMLPRRFAWLVCGVAVVSYSVQMWFDSAAHIQHLSKGYRWHLVGMWINFVISAVVMSFFISQLIKQINQQHLALQKASEENLNNEQLIGLATVAASTVHTLATPLATLSILTESIARKPDKVDEKELSLMLAQVDRCKSTMKSLSSLAQQSGEMHTLPSKVLYTDILEHYSLHQPGNMPVFDFIVPDQTHVQYNGLLQYALINLINNAIEAGSRSPLVEFTVEANNLAIKIENDTAENPQAIQQRWGKPSESDKQSGLGIGSFLANSTIEKQKGTVQFYSMNDAKAGKFGLLVKLPLVV